MCAAALAGWVPGRTEGCCACRLLARALPEPPAFATPLHSLLLLACRQHQHAWWAHLNGSSCLLCGCCVAQVTGLVSDALFILLVEKDAAFMRLAEDRWVVDSTVILTTIVI